MPGARERRQSRLREGEFAKYHALGNDYLVIDAERFGTKLTRARVRSFCTRHTGAGSDGLLALSPSSRADFAVRIFNPDGSEAEKSGNGVRILARFLRDFGYTRRTGFSIETKGGVVYAELSSRPDAPERISVFMWILEQPRNRALCVAVSDSYSFTSKLSGALVELILVILFLMKV